jgi:hypothetical protein
MGSKKSFINTFADIDPLIFESEIIIITYIVTQVDDFLSASHFNQYFAKVMIRITVFIYGL